MKWETHILQPSDFIASANCIGYFHILHPSISGTDYSSKQGGGDCMGREVFFLVLMKSAGLAVMEKESPCIDSRGEHRNQCLFPHATLPILPSPRGTSSRSEARSISVPTQNSVSLLTIPTKVTRPNLSS